MTTTIRKVFFDTDRNTFQFMKSHGILDDPVKFNEIMNKAMKDMLEKSYGFIRK